MLNRNLFLKSLTNTTLLSVHIKCFLQNGKVIEDSEKELVIGEGKRFIFTYLCIHVKNSFFSQVLN